MREHEVEGHERRFPNGGRINGRIFIENEKYVAEVVTWNPRGEPIYLYRDLPRDTEEKSREKMRGEWEDECSLLAVQSQGVVV